MAHEPFRTEFDNSPATRVAIAKEVINILNDRQKIYLQKGNYCSFKFPINPEIELNTQLDSNLGNKDCHICALGALFISSVIKFGNFRTKETSPPQKEIRNYLCHFFSIDQLKSIEVAFEGGYEDFIDITEVDVNHSYLNKNYPKEIKFYEKYNDKSKLIVAIMENIMANGEFKP